jgi:ferritin-like metal-binding protein YciE
VLSRFYIRHSQLGNRSHAAEIHFADAPVRLTGVRILGAVPKRKFACRLHLTARAKVKNDRAGEWRLNMSVETAEDLFIEELKDIYSAEKQAVKAYPRLAKVVQSEELKEALQEHLEQTKQQIERLDRVFEVLEKRAGGKTCEGMKGLLDEAAKHTEEIEPGAVLDAALLGALQRVEHYEIAAYGTVATFAEAMGQDEIQELLAETLQEEKDTDQKLTEVSENVDAAAIGGGEEEEDELEDEEEDAEEEDEEEDEENDDEAQGDESEEDAPQEKPRTQKATSQSGGKKKRT